MLNEKYIQRCLQLAKLGSGYVAPNPMVGAVLVFKERIIGEGCHQQYGMAHAEVNCIHSVKEEDLHFIPQSTLYVSLEPCVHFGKTPPCTDLIIHSKIPEVVIGCLDPFKEVDGKGIEKLRSAGIKVNIIKGETKKESKDLNKRFFVFHTEERPYIILKWAETGDGKMALPVSKDCHSHTERLFISNEYSNRLVHQWRSEESAILIGTSTALMDDPELTTRLWNGNSPVRLVLDMKLKLPSTLKIFNKTVKTIIFNAVKNEEDGNLVYYKLSNEASLIPQLTKALYDLKIQSILVEGGAKLLQSFIDEGIWDEARVIKNENLIIGNGLKAPVLISGKKCFEQKIITDKIYIYKKLNSSVSLYHK